MTRSDDDLRRHLTAAMLGQPPASAGPPRLVQLCFRRNGRRLARVWGDGAGLAAALHDAIAKAAIPPARVTHIEVTLARPGRPMVPADLTRARVNDFRGLMGIELRAGGQVARIGPLEMVTRDRKSVV